MEEDVSEGESGTRWGGVGDGRISARQGVKEKKAETAYTPPVGSLPLFSTTPCSVLFFSSSGMSSLQ
jgi:hypothetical protein